MGPTIVSSAMVVLFAMPLFAARAQADPEDLDFFTDFEDVNPNTSVGEPIEVGTPPETAELSGDAFGGVVGIGQLYHSGLRAWMVLASGTGFIDFVPDAGEVQFWATAHSSANANTVITAFDSSDVVVGMPVTLTPGSGFQLVSFSGAIASIEVENNASNQLNGIDDFGFTPVPEPGAMLTLVSGGAFLAILGRKRATHGKVGTTDTTRRSPQLAPA